jgi:hypothetical protein
MRVCPPLAAASRMVSSIAAPGRDVRRITGVRLRALAGSGQRAGTRPSSTQPSW